MKTFRLIVLGICLMVFPDRTFSQMVTISDANMLNWLQNNYPSCITGSQLDTTCVDIVNEVSVNISSIGANDLTGIQYFDNLQTLQCGGNNNTTLPVLPSGLIELNCSNGVLTGLPQLPVGLEKLNCSGNNLVTLQTVLPATLYEIRCNNNNLTMLPDLPVAIEFLLCSHNNLSALPALPNGINFLNCSFNSIAVLPDLPNSLTKFYCQENILDTLPHLPDSMDFVIAFNNQIKHVTDFPKHVNSTIDLSGNLLTELPDFPTVISTFKANNNQIRCIPVLPWGMYVIQMSGNSISCIPNYVAAISNNPYFDTIPYCEYDDTGVNPYGCVTRNGAHGEIRHDVNLNCENEDSDVAVKHIPIKMVDVLGELEKSTNSEAYGLYDIQSASGVHVLKIDTLDKPYTVDCQNPGPDSVITLVSLDTVQDIDFLINCKPGFDVGTQSVVAIGAVQSGMQHTVHIQAGDISDWYGNALNCAFGINGEVIVTVDGPVNYIGPGNGALIPMINGNSYTYIISDFANVDMDNDFSLIFETLPGALVRDSVCVDIEVTPTLGDNTVHNNTVRFCYEITENYSGTMKTVRPSRVYPGYENWLTYTVHFQNTGLNEVSSIRVEDVLSTNLDWQTLEVIGNSHDFEYEYHAFYGHFNVYFNDANLPTHLADEMASRGYIQYRVKPLSSLPFGTVIENSAKVYFDNELHLETDPAVTSYTGDLGLDEFNDEFAVTLYPNPNQGEIFVDSKLNLTGANIRIHDLLGRKIAFHQIVTDGKTLLIIDPGYKGIIVINIQLEEREGQFKLLLN